MMMVTHAAIAGAAGEYIGNPWIAFPLGMVIHLVMDKVPHFWPSLELGKNIVKVTDTVLTTIFILVLFFIPVTNKASLISGALGGIIIDIVLVFILGAKGRIAEWHTNRQPHQTNPWYLLTDIGQFVLGLILILAQK